MFLPDSESNWFFSGHQKHISKSLRYRITSNIIVELQLPIRQNRTHSHSSVKKKDKKKSWSNVASLDLSPLSEPYSIQQDSLQEEKLIVDQNDFAALDFS